MKRIIGIKSRNPAPAPPPPPGISDCISIVDKRAEEAEKKAAKCEADLRKLKDQIKKSRPGPGQEVLKQKARRIMQQLKTYQGQSDTLRQQSFGMDQATTALETATETQVIVSTMKSGAKQLKKKLDETSVDEIEDLQDAMAELLDTSQDIQEALTPQSYTTPDIDDEELQAEFDALGDELADEGSSVVPDLEAAIYTGPGSSPPPPPMGPSTNTSTTLEERRNINGAQIDEYGLPILPNVPEAEKLG